nr:hypothetical protein GCM10020092_066320 [Actinoplanes digitatis]
MPVGSATDITLLASAPKPADTTGYSPVFDCNNYEPRPWKELGFTRTVTDTAAGRTVRLSAADHAACTKVVVRKAVPGQLYRVRLEYRSVTGARPQICLWQAGVAGCELSARPVLDDKWSTYEKTVTMDSLADELQIILHADVGERLKPKTVTEYRNLTVDALEPVDTKTVFPPAVPEVKVHLTAGSHELRVEGGMSGSALAPFEPLNDCYRYDDQTAEQAGLEAESAVGADGETTYTLKAVRHLACIGAPVADMGASSLYELSLEARSVALRNPKFCLYLRGPDLCRTLPQRWRCTRAGRRTRRWSRPTRPPSTPGSTCTGCATSRRSVSRRWSIAGCGCARWPPPARSCWCATPRRVIAPRWTSRWRIRPGSPARSPAPAPSPRSRSPRTPRPAGCSAASRVPGR